MAMYFCRPDRAKRMFQQATSQPDIRPTNNPRLPHSHSLPKGNGDEAAIKVPTKSPDTFSFTSKAIKNGDIGVNMLGDELFKKAYKLKGGEGSADNIAAFAVGDQIFVRRSSANILSETVHEGTHALDFLRGLPDETTEDLWSLEKRAFFYERQYQRAVGSSVDFASIDEMLEFIFENY